MSKEHNNTLKIPLYGNCRVQNPEGTHIFNCGEKKAKWYLKRGLAEIIQEIPLVIRLNFIPNGQGHANDAFYLQERQNICVCCGTKKLLTKHHVVPYCYRRFFPEHLKNHTAYDVLPLCYDCHEKYEVFAHQFKQKLAGEYAVTKENSTVIDPELKKVCLYATALLRQKKIPVDRYNMMMGVIQSYYRREVTTKDLEEASQIRYNTNREDYKPEGKSVVENLDNIEVFVKRWRQHFVEHTKPAFLPKYWHIDRPL